jgi:hypothetical protein
MSKALGICNLNYLDTDYLTSRSYSSQKTAYPASNVYDLQRRSKVWRTAGHFLIEAGKNTIIFREQAGVDLTATVTAGDYASIAAFLVALKTALEAAGVATYTCEFLTASGKFKITSALDGGATVFQLMTTNASFLDMAGILGFDTAANFTGASNYTADVIRIHTDEYLLWDMGFPVNPKVFALAGDRNATLRLSASATVTLEGNSTSNFTAPAFSTSITLDDYMLAKWDLTNGLCGAGSSGYRYWRVKIVDKANTRQYLEFGIVYLGDAYSTTRGCAVFPMNYEMKDESIVIYGEAGQGFGQDLPMTQTVGLEWDAVSKSEEQQLRQFYEIKKKVNAFFIVIDTDTQADLTGAFSENQKEWVKLVKFASDPSFHLAGPNYWQGSWTLREEI